MLLPITPVRLTGSMEYEQNFFQKKRNEKPNQTNKLCQEKRFRRGLR
jgi:hypothetical protein